MCRVIIFPENILKLIKVYEPFMINHELTNPTPEAKEAFERYMHEHPLREKQVSIYYDFNPMNGF